MRVAVIGAGSCFAVNLATHLVARGDEVLGISRSPMRGPAFTLGLESNVLYKYEQAHLVSQLSKVLGLLDNFRPDCIFLTIWRRYGPSNH